MGEEMERTTIKGLLYPADHIENADAILTECHGIADKLGIHHFLHASVSYRKGHILQQTPILMLVFSSLKKKGKRCFKH